MNVHKQAGTYSIIKNPILKGFNPDPSICRKGDDYYIVTSSFSYFPGLPVYHSRNLTDWTFIGHALDRTSQLPLDPLRMSHGIWAPSIRYHDGLFYIIVTNVTYGGNFYITARDPKGPWSEPYWIEGTQVGIDPDLFFDDDGQVYYISTTPYGSPEYDSQQILISAIDLENSRLTGKPWVLWGGAVKGAHSPEAPHLYKKDGWYYLMIAEGGTDYYHSIVIARSRSLFSPFEGYRGNPILTHRHLGKKWPITCVGHGDLVETCDGRWFMTLLGCRNLCTSFQSIGRETFLVPVEWEDGWPIVSPGSGRVEFNYRIADVERPNRAQRKQQPFNGKTESGWHFIGTPWKNFYRSDKDSIYLKLLAQNLTPEDKAGCGYKQLKFTLANPEIPSENACISFIGRKQTDFSYKASVQLDFMPDENNQSAGMVILQNNFNHLRIERTMLSGEPVIRVMVCRTAVEDKRAFAKETTLHYTVKELFRIHDTHEKLILAIQACHEKFSFYYGAEDGEMKCILADVSGSFLGDLESVGFTGVHIGLFASGNGVEYDKEAQFENFEYIGYD